MIDKIIKELFSMRMMTLGLLIFLTAIAKATFIESYFGTPASKIAIYNTYWFELLLLYLSLGLIVNIFKYRMYRREKIAVFSFHIAFIIIIFGAAFTRYVGFEGQMPILEGETTNVMYSSDPYLVIRANDQVNEFTYEEQRWLSEGRENPFHVKFQLPNQPTFYVDYASYEENFIDTIVVADSIESEALEFVVNGETVYLFKGHQMTLGNTFVSFDFEEATQGVTISKKNGELLIQSNEKFEIIDMMRLSREDRINNTVDESAITKIPADSSVRFDSGRLYSIGDESLMFKEYRRNIAKTRQKAKKRDEGTHYLTVNVTDGVEEKTIEIEANHDHRIQYERFHLADLYFEIGYGAKPILLPFSIRCNDFQLERYPGSEMPSSFASEVTLIDDSLNVAFDQRIFMNNVMDYKGYRFFQSSYFPDESGTVLSVNYDWWGTNITYLGYLLMSIGMLLSIFAPQGRFKLLNKLIKKSRNNRLKMKSLLVIIFASASFNVAYSHGDHEHNHDDEDHHEHHHDHDHDHEKADKDKFENHADNFAYITKDQSKVFEDLLVQDYDGRIIPFYTLSERILRKVHYNNSFQGKNPVQVVIGFHLYGPTYWNDKPIVFVSNKIRDDIGLGKYASIIDLEDEQGQFKWIEDYNSAFEKPDSKKAEYDKQLIKLGERYRVLKEVFAFQHFRVIPIPGDQRGTWVWPFALELKDKDQTGNQLATNILSTLYAVTQGKARFSLVKEYLDDLKTLQWQFIENYQLINPSAELPSKNQINAEIMYDKLNPFDKIKNVYFIVGFLMLILFFVRTLSAKALEKERLFKRITLPFFIVIGIVFVLHGVGLGLRWYISGHAPWSNGYEAVIFIAWSTVVAGLIFIKKNPAVLAATVLLAGMMLFVTELNLLDPEITPLEPVLKSYWLMIHVAVITSSYGFLGLAAILSIVNLLLFLFKNNENKKRLSMNINEITAVSEMTMTIGLFMLTIGTFLGGVWANESWGRYWGWDPKETWALVSVLAYAVILHLRFIPKINNKFIFNAVGLWGYSAILFTFFGVNFKLVGLHSYAQGDGVAETPFWVWITISVFALFTIASGVKYYTSKFK